MVKINKIKKSDDINPDIFGAIKTCTLLVQIDKNILESILKILPLISITNTLIVSSLVALFIIEKI